MLPCAACRGSSPRYRSHLRELPPELSKPTGFCYANQINLLMMMRGGITLDTLTVAYACISIIIDGHSKLVRVLEFLDRLVALRALFEQYRAGTMLPSHPVHDGPGFSPLAFPPPLPAGYMCKPSSLPSPSRLLRSLTSQQGCCSAAVFINRSFHVSDSVTRRPQLTLLLVVYQREQGPGSKSWEAISCCIARSC